MARFDGGWVKLWRKAALGDINSNYTRGGLFGALVAMANIQQSTVSWRGKPRKLERGQIATSLRELAALGEVEHKTVRKHLQYLQERNTISLEISKFGTLITINNYEKYQGLDTGSDDDLSHGIPHGMANTMEDTMANGVPHIEERKNIRKKEVSAAVVPTTDADLISLFSQSELNQFKKLYPEVGWVEREAIRAIQWCAVNPKKRPQKNYRRFFTNWLERGWERYRKTLPSEYSGTGGGIVEIFQPAAGGENV